MHPNRYTQRGLVGDGLTLGDSTTLRIYISLISVEFSACIALDTYEMIIYLANYHYLLLATIVFVSSTYHLIVFLNCDHQSKNESELSASNSKNPLYLVPHA